MILTYSGRSAPSARRIAGQDGDIELNRGSRGDINWGRAKANTQLNPDISNSTNKRVMRELFAEHEVPTPRIACLDEVLNNNHGHKFVGRPDTHRGGRGLWLCQSSADAERAMRGTRRKAAATHFMEFIDAPREYRVHIFKGKSIRISEKRFGTTGDTAHGLYTTAKPNPEHKISHVRKAAKAAVEALGLDFGAVDILANDDECWVLEVNAAPGLGGTMPQVYARVFEEWQNGEWNE